MHNQTPDSAPITIEVSPLSPDVAVVRLAGPLDRETSPLARAEILAAVAQGQSNLILDVRDVPSIDGAGANSLLFGMHRAQQAGGGLRLVAPTELVTQRLALAALDEVLPIHATVGEALEVLDATAAMGELPNTIKDSR